MASILDDYLSTPDPLNEPPSTGIPPTAYNSGGGTVALPFSSTSVKGASTSATTQLPKTTTTQTLTPETKTVAKLS